MKAESLMILSDAREVLQRARNAELHSNPLAGAFIGWLLRDEVAIALLDQIAQQAATAKGADRSSRTVAILGYACGIECIKPRFVTAFCQQMEWLMGMPNFMGGGEPAVVVADPLSFTGVVIGAEAVAGNDVLVQFKQWAMKVWKDAYTLLEEGNWRRGVLTIIGERLKAGNGLSQSTIQPAWLPASLQRSGWGVPAEMSIGEVLKTAIGAADKVADTFEAGLRMEAIEWAMTRVMDFDVAALTIKDVAGVLKRSPEVFQRWTWELKPRTGKKDGEPRRWHIENEYHVQSLLYTVLKPVFENLEEERYLAATGTYQPRADLCLLSLQLLIEVKFWYKRDNARHLIEEISADLTLYLRNDSPYRSVIAVIWDDGARTEEHAELRRGLLGLTGLYDIVIINRPAFMNDACVSISMVKKKRQRSAPKSAEG